MKLKLLCFLLSSSLFAFQWPSDYSNMISSFYTRSLDNTYKDGLVFKGESLSVFPMSDGEVVFQSEGMEWGKQSIMPSEGDFLILEHKGQYRSVYQGYESLSFGAQNKYRMTDLLGTMTDSEFLFALYDTKLQQYVNPQLVLPVQEDLYAPVIGSVVLESGQTTYRVVNNVEVPDGMALLYFDAWDIIISGGKQIKTMPYSIYIFIDGLEVFKVSFDALREIDNKIYLIGDENIDTELFRTSEKNIYAGKIYLNRGRSIIEVVVRDIFGNETSRSYALRVGG